MDTTILQSINSFAGQSVGFDLFVDFVQGSYLVKGLFAVCVLVMIHASYGHKDVDKRNNIYATLILVFATLFLARIMQMTLPLSPRPLHTAGLDLNLATGINRSVLSEDSSFPSDHAVMFLTIATSVLLYARTAGLVLLTHALFIICLPRIYLGFHWPSDIAVGAVIGITFALLFHRRIADWLSRTRLADWQTAHPSLFYGLFFIILTETATMYRGARHLISALGEFVRLAL